MASTDVEEVESENKSLVTSLAEKDGKLVSPIDLSLDDTRHLKLERLMWMNFNNKPVKMKLTNTGETVIISGKWNIDRPHLCGGPLDGNYVFSQIHFHWGSDEHEGSEHTVRGISYPMEVHVVFYKTRYLTQEAALKKEDGVIIVVYLVKLQDKTTPGLHWLVNHLDKVVQPQTATPLPLTPLSTLLVPFNMDYLLYWGLVVSHRCAHTMLWFVSRAAFSITVEHLNMFRKLLNSRKEPMNKNFRGVSPNEGRTVFHVNPSKENKHLLLPGTIDPPEMAVIVNYSQMEPLDYVQAKKIFNKGDSTDDDIKESYKIKTATSSTKTYTFCEGTQREAADSLSKRTRYRRSSTRIASKETCAYLSNAWLLRHNLNRDDSLHKTKLQKRKHAMSRKNLERQRRQGFEKTDTLLKTAENLEIKLSTVQKSYSNKSLNQFDTSDSKQKNNQRLDVNNNEESVLKELESPNKGLEDLSQHFVKSGQLENGCKFDDSMKYQTETQHLFDKLSNPQDMFYKEAPKEKHGKSRLPIRRKGLQSSLAVYFSQADSAKGHNTTRSNQTSPDSSVKLKTQTTTIPRLIGRNAGKIEESCGIHNLRNPQRRPTSSPTKFNEQRK